MRIEDWLKESEQYLSSHDVPTARLDALVLLEDSTGKERSWLLAHPEYDLSASQVASLQNLLSRRASHEPLAYVRGKIEFYGREFIVTSAVLQPRPESETMIDLLKQLPLFTGKEGHMSTQNRDLPARSNNAAKTVKIADIGAGSGALGITAALELPNTSVELLEIDENAIEVAKMNVDLFTITISVIKSNLLANSKQAYDVLLCNLPYVPDSHTVNKAARHEPDIALFGGPDGLDLYRKLFRQIDDLENKPLYILSEALPPQHAKLVEIALKSGYKQLKSADFIQVFENSDK